MFSTGAASPPSTVRDRWAADKAWMADGLPDLFYGLGFLTTALVCFVLLEGQAFTLAMAAFGFAGGRLFHDLRGAAKAALADPEPGGFRRRLPRLARWRVVGLVFFLALVLATAAARLGALAATGYPDAPDSALARWWPLLLTVPLPLMFVASWRQLDLPRHLAVGLVSLAGALAGPLLGLLWQDSLALAAAVQGLALVVSGALALRAHLRTRSRRSAP